MTGLWQSVVHNAAEIYEPDNTVGLVGLLIINGGAIIAAVGSIVLNVISVKSQRKGVEDRKAIKEIHEQTVNTHDTNLRDDLDMIARGVERLEEGQASQGIAIRDLQRDVGGIREEIRTERKERIAGDRRWQ